MKPEYHDWHVRVIRPNKQCSSNYLIYVPAVFDFLVDVILEDELPSREAMLAEQADCVDLDEMDGYDKIQSCRC